MKRPALPFHRTFLAAPLALALFGAAPAQAKTWVVALKSPFSEYTQIQITNPDGVFGIPRPGFGAWAERGFITARHVGEAELQTTFGPALEAMQAILAAGLPALPISYASLLEHRQGPLGQLQVQAHNRIASLKSRSAAIRIDGVDWSPFVASPEQIQSDFGPALEAMEAARRAGAPLATYVALLENPDGGVGQVMVADARGQAAIREPGAAINLDPYAAPLEVVSIDRARIEADFADSLNAMPALPQSFTLFFERGSTELNAASKKTLEEILASLRSRASAEIRIEGHADSLGRAEFNERLATRRAEQVAALLRQGGDHATIEVQAFGERKPRVHSPDNTVEPQNRRVEVFIR